MTVLNPKITGDPIVDSWALSVTQEINALNTSGSESSSGSTTPSTGSGIAVWT